MAELEVIYDPVKELAAIVNVDDRCGWGPAMIGPQAGQILQAFIDATPFDISELPPYDVARAFRGFLEQAGLLADETTAATDLAPPQSSGNPDVGAADRLAEREASEAGDTPAAQPADTDLEADAGTPDQVIPCVNCNGTGVVEFGGDQPSMTCGMCKGVGKLTVAAA